MTEERPLKIGIIGAGSIVRHCNLPGIKSAGGTEIIAVCNSTVASAQAFCDEFAPDAVAFESYPEVVAHPEVDVVWIGTPPSMQFPVSIASLREGKHVFCQSQMARDFAEAEQMWETSLSNPELIAALSPTQIGFYGDLSIKKALADGLIGIPHQIVLRSLSPTYLDPSAPPHWRQLYDVCGLQILSLGSYVEVLQRWFGEITAVSAHGKIVTPVREGDEIEIPDLLHVLCSFATGVEGSLTFSGVADHAGGDRLEVFGSKGTIVYDFENDSIHVGAAGDPELRKIEIPMDLENPWTVEADFLHAVRDPGSPRPEPDFTEGLRCMKVIEAVQTSLDSGKRIPV